jgi:translation initiation factor eIF-2B subunit beta
MIGSCKFIDTKQIMHYVRALGQVLQQAAPAEFSIGNIVRRVLYIIREEYAHKLKELAEGTSEKVKDMSVNPRKDKTRSNSALSDASENEDQDENELASVPMPSPAPRGLSLSSVFEGTSEKKFEDTFNSSKKTFTKSLDFSQYFDMRKGVLTAINELHSEMDNVQQPIEEVAKEHIHSQECVMVIGDSGSVEGFIRAVPQGVHFNVIVVAEGKDLIGHKHATSLAAKSNISVTLIPEAGVYAIMSRVNKVFFSQ